MPLIQRGTITEDFRNGLDLDSVRTGKYVNEASEKVVLTYDYSNARYTKNAFTTRTTSGTTTMLATPTDRDIYITDASFNFTCDAASDANTLRIQATINGQTTDLINLRHTTLTAVENAESTRTFFTPLKIDRGTNITANLTFAVGTAGIFAAISYLEVI